MAYEDKCVYCGDYIWNKIEAIETEQGNVCSMSCHIDFQEEVKKELRENALKGKK